jgi:hypothetical protein
MTPAESPPTGHSPRSPLELLPPELHLHILTHLLPPFTSTLTSLLTYLHAVPTARETWMTHRGVLLPLLSPQIAALQALEARLLLLLLEGRGRRAELTFLLLKMQMEMARREVQVLVRIGGGEGGV